MTTWKSAVLSLALVSRALSDEPFLMPVEDVFPISGIGTVVNGKVQRGSLKVGDKLALVGLNQDAQAVVTGLSRSGQSISEVKAGDECGVIFRSLNANQVARGQVLAVPGSVSATDLLEGVLTGKLPAPGQRVLVRIHSAGLSANVESADGARFKLRLLQPVAAQKGFRLSILEGGREVATGQLTSP